MMEHQRCIGLLANSSYRLADEIVTDYPQSAEFSMTLHVTHALD